MLQLGGLFRPGLLDDVDSVYLEIAREMLARHNFVTPFVDGIRFFDKPPLMYWLAAGSMHLLGSSDWAARLPLALITLALLLATYALGLRLFAAISPDHAPDRGALYAALALGTSLGPYLYTRFYIPDIALTLCLTLSIHLLLCAVGRARLAADRLPLSAPVANALAPNLTTPPRPLRSRVPGTFAPMLAFSATLAASVLTKGLIGLIFPVGFALGYLLLTRQLPLLRRLHPFATAAAFLALALPWHILAALQNPAIPMPPGVGLPARAGWAWFYLYNEHIARFFSARVPHDYGQVPIPLFLALAALWLVPWAAFLPAAVLERVRELRGRSATGPRCHEAALALFLWIALVLGFFTLSARQEYYSLPCLPALALLVGGLLARADRNRSPEDHTARRAARRAAAWLLTPFATLLGLLAAFFAITAPRAVSGEDISAVLARASASTSYNLSLSHLADLTPAAMALFRGPLFLTAAAMLTLGPVAWLIRRRGHTVAANLTLAAAATALLLAVHAGLVRFYPTLGSKTLALDVLRHQAADPLPPGAPADLLLIDGELTAGSTLLFYTHQPVHLVDGRINGPWFGSFWPDAPPIFETGAFLHTLWSGPHRLFLLTYHPTARARDLAPFGPVYILASAGGKSILTNRP